MDKNVRLAKTKWQRIQATTQPIIENITSGTFTPSDLNSLSEAINAQSRLAYYLFDKQVKAMDLQAKSYKPEIETQLKQVGIDATEDNVNVVVDKVFQRLVSKQFPLMVKNIKNNLSKDDSKFTRIIGEAKPIKQKESGTTLDTIKQLVIKIPDNVYAKIKSIVPNKKVEQPKQVEEKPKNYLGKLYDSVKSDIQDYYGVTEAKEFIQSSKESIGNIIETLPQPTTEQKTQPKKKGKVKTTKHVEPKQKPSVLQSLMPSMNPVYSLIDSLRGDIERVAEQQTAQSSNIRSIKEDLTYKDEPKQVVQESQPTNYIEKFVELKRKADRRYKDIKQKLGDLDESPILAHLKKAAVITGIAGIAGIALASIDWKKLIWDWIFGKQAQEQEQQTQGVNAQGEQVQVFTDENGLKHVITTKADGSKETSSGTLDPRVDKDGYITEDKIDGEDGNSTEYIKYNPTTGERKRQIVYHDTGQEVNLSMRPDGKVLAEPNTQTSELKGVINKENAHLSDYDFNLAKAQSLKPTLPEKITPITFQEYGDKNAKYRQSMNMARAGKDVKLPGKSASADSGPTIKNTQSLAPKQANTNTPAPTFEMPSQTQKKQQLQGTQQDKAGNKRTALNEYLTLSTTSPNGTKSDETLAMLTAGVL